MIELYFYMFVMFIFCGVIGFCFKSYHFMISLLTLEYMVLVIYLMVIFLVILEDIDYYFSMVYLVLSVCEGALGLSVLVSILRSFGNDFFGALNILLW